MRQPALEPLIWVAEGRLGRQACGVRSQDTGQQGCTWVRHMAAQTACVQQGCTMGPRHTAATSSSIRKPMLMHLTPWLTSGIIFSSAGDWRTQTSKQAGGRETSKQLEDGGITRRKCKQAETLSSHGAMPQPLWPAAPHLRPLEACPGGSSCGAHCGTSAGNNA